MIKNQPHSINFRNIFLNFESLIFVISQISVGFLNYLFQIYASKTLNTIDFGSWSHWLAQFSVTCFVGVWLQSLTSIGDAESWFHLKKSRLLMIALWLGFLFSVFLKNESILFFFAWAASLLNGFWFGVHLRTKHIRLLAIASLLGVLAKFIWVLLDPSSFSFYRAQALAPLIACSFFLIFSKLKISSPTARFQLYPQVALASISLAFFASWVPQVDLLVLPQILSASEFGLFAKVALLNKGFYFAFQTLAQLLLAYQVQPGSARLSGRHFFLFGLFGTLAAGGGFGVALYLGWPASWAVLSLFHMTSLCLLFLALQDLASRHQGALALTLCLLSVLLALVGKSFGWQAESYWSFSILIELVTILGLVRFCIKNQDLSKN